MTDETQNERDDALAAEYVVGVLPHDERQTANIRLRSDQDFADRVARWEAHMDGLNDDYGLQPAPERVKVLIDQRLFGAPKPEAPWRRWFGGAAIAAVLAFVAVLFALTTTRSADLRADLRGAGDATITVTVDRAAAEMDIQLAAAPVTAGTVFEMWLVPEGAAPISLGIFSADARLDLNAAPALIPGATLAVSIEPLGGSPTGAPTGPVIASGVLSDA